MVILFSCLWNGNALEPDESKRMHLTLKAAGFRITVIACVVIVAPTVCSLVTTPKDTPRTTASNPLSVVQPSIVPPGRSAASCNETGQQKVDGVCGINGGSSSEDGGHTTSDHKRTPCLLPADNFGLFCSHDQAHSLCLRS